MKFQVLVNSGGAKIYLQQTAEDLSTQNGLLTLISGIILAKDSKIRKHFPKSRILKKIYERSGDFSVQKQIQISFQGEIFWQLAIVLQRRLKTQFLSQLFFWVASGLYANTAKNFMRRQHQDIPIIYHVRSGFGGASIKMAKNLGYKVVVDHSIAHPDFFFRLQADNSRSRGLAFSMDRRIRWDLSEADLVIVNSDFVSDTFNESNFQGIVKVAIPPIEKSFSQILRSISSARSEISFIGRCEYRKGIDTVLDIVRNLDPSTRVNIVGNWDSASHHVRSEFQRLPNVTIYPYLDMAGIVEILSRTRIFLFPSRAEGAARVVGEAMHAGCVVFTTLEAGVPVPVGAGYLINDLSITDLHSEIVGILENDLEFNRMSSNARIHISHLETLYFSNLHGIYEEVLEL